MAEAPPALHGVLVIDKPRGPTSHDVVARCRKLLRDKHIGHAGTLDPMATGVLVVLVGEATKLAPYLTAADKTYLARIALGIGTATLDADGEILTRAPVPTALLDELRHLRDATALPALPSSAIPTASAPLAPPALPASVIATPSALPASAAHLTADAIASALPAPTALPPAGALLAALREEAARAEQIPPAYSAIHVDGERSHDLARAGRDVALPPRPVAVRAYRLLGAQVDLADPAEPPALDLEITVAKGYYVRSLARDLGQRLALPAHLSQLRRTASGPFTLARSVALDAGPDALRAALIPVATAVALTLPLARLTPAGCLRARHGKRLTLDDFTPEAPPPPASISAWLDETAQLVAIGEPQAEAFVVLRGFVAR